MDKKHLGQGGPRTSKCPMTGHPLAASELNPLPRGAPLSRLTHGDAKAGASRSPTGSPSGVSQAWNLPLGRFSPCRCSS